MKQLLVIAVALTAINAQASRARVAALQSPAHLVDTQTVYTNPSDILRISGDYVTFESGATQSTLVQTAEMANAEGMIVRTMGDAKLGLSLGHQSKNASSWGLRGATPVTAALKVNQQNPIEFTYGMKSGDINWAGTLVYSNYNNKQAAVGVLEKESSMGLRFGANSGAWNASLGLGLTNTAQLNTGNKFTGALGLSLAGGYQWETMYFNAGLTSAGAKEETTTGTEALKLNSQSITLGVTNVHKKDGNELFYGASLTQTEDKANILSAGDNKVTSLKLPLIIGFEAEAASWLTFRSSVTQTVLINQSKTVNAAGTTTAETDPGANTTTVAFGAGLKFNKLTIDGTISGLTAGGQTIGTNTLLSQVGVGYWF
ncbi:hypothetical protein K2P97_08405 [bacterium]|nr:hypothetical protein [bacterium]